MRKDKDYHLEDPTWCRGCGLFALFSAFKKAAVSLKIPPEELMIVTGIGCHGRFNNYFRCYGFHALHGRTLPVATGIKLVNPKLNVVGISGDGDAYSIGLGHFLHSMKRNINVTFIVINNLIFALTQGQTSPTSPRGLVSISHPYGSPEHPLDGLRLALAAGATFIARGFSGEPAHLASLLKRGIRHKGFSLIEVLSPCVTYNKVITYQWFKNNIEWLDQDSEYDSKDIQAALDRTHRDEKIPVGLVFQQKKPSFESLVYQDEDRPLVSERLRIKKAELKKIMDGFE